MKYRRTFDHLLLAAMAFRKGNVERASRFFQRAMDEPDADQALEELDSAQQETIEEAPEQSTARFARSLKAKQVAKTRGRRRALAQDDLDEDLDTVQESDDQFLEDLQESEDEMQQDATGDTDEIMEEDLAEDQIVEDQYAQDDDPEQQDQVQSRLLRRQKRAQANARHLRKAR